MTSVRIFSASFMILLTGAGIVHAQTISPNPQTLSFTYQIGGATPAAQNISLNADVPTQFSVSISGAPWLSVAPTGGITPSNLVATVTPPANATPGTLTGTILIGPPASLDSVKTVVPVSLQI